MSFCHTNTMAKKTNALHSSRILLVGLIIVTLWAGAATLMMFKMNSFSKFAKNSIQEKNKIEKQDLYSYVSYFGEWTEFQIPNTEITFQYPSKLRVVQNDVALDSINVKNKEIIPSSSLTLAFPEELRLVETSRILKILTSKEPVGVLTTLDASGDIPEFIDISQHTEQFGKKNIWILKAKYDDGPCAGSYFYRYIIPYSQTNVVVEHGCASYGYFSHSAMERFLSSFSE